MKTPHNFIINLRTVNPRLGRLFDGVTRLGLSDGNLRARLDPSRWPGSELIERKDELDDEAGRFFGGGCRTVFETAPLPEDFLPAPITATKYYNHVAFLHFGPGERAGYFVVRKTVYAEIFRKGGFSPPDGGDHLLLKPVPCAPGEGYGTLLRDLPEICDTFCGLARAAMSYVQILCPFPGHDFADELESRLYAVKEWGTPATPPAFLQKHLGRIHYTDRGYCPGGFKYLIF